MATYIDPANSSLPNEPSINIVHGGDGPVIKIRNEGLGNTIEVTAAPNTSSKIQLQSGIETEGTDASETIRIYSLTDAAKGAIAFYPDTSIARSKAWLQAHKYLHLYNPLSFDASVVNTGTDRITAAPLGNAYVDGLGVTATSTGTLPAPLVGATLYYIKKISGGVFSLYSDSTLTTLVDLTTQGTGTITLTPDLTTNNNLHQHFSIEVSDSSGTAKQTRLSIPFDFDTTELGFFSSNVNVNDAKLRVLGSAGSFKELQYGNTPSSNLTPDGTSIRWSVRQDNTAEAGSNVGSDFRIVRYTDVGAAIDQPFFIKRSNGCVGIQCISPTVQLEIGTSTSTTSQARVNRAANTNTAGILFTTGVTDRWFTGMRNDSTDNWHLRDSANGRSLIQASQSGYLQTGGGLRVPVGAKTAAYTVAVTDYYLTGDATTATFAFTLPAATGSGQVFYFKKIDASANAVTISRAGADTIEGGTSLSLAAQWNSVGIIDYASGKWGKLQTT